MNILLIIFGFVFDHSGARIFGTSKAQGGQGIGRGVITLAVQITGCALVILSLIRIFS